MTEPAHGAAEGSVRPLFLLSLPRSGSTLLQRLLSNHPAVATTAEPWLLLPLLYALRRDGVYAEYDHRTMTRAMEDLVGALPDGPASYRREVRRFAERIYAQLADRPGATHFLDKTPRYTLVVDDLLEAFPDAAFIVLWRDPLAILASLSDTWADGRWQPHHHKVDLFTGLERLVAAVERQPDRFVSVRYEDLVSAPDETLAGLLDAVGLDHRDDLPRGLPDLGGRVGDQTGVERYDEVSTVSLERWERSLRSPYRRWWAGRYLRWIGADRLDTMGYDLDDRLAALAAADTSLATLPSDLWLAAKGVLYDGFEPPLLRDKLRSVREWRRVVKHT